MTRYGGTKAVVLGGTAGVGLAIAKRLVEGGAQVLVTGHAARECAAAAPEVGSAARVVGCDPTDPADVRALARAVRDGLGAYDVLFADADAEGESGIGTGVVRALLPALADGGAVVLTAPAGQEPGGVLHSLAAELRPRGIRVNAVAPGGAGADRTALAPEIARAALFLATEAAFTTGATLPVAGTPPA